MSRNNHRVKKGGRIEQMRQQVETLTLRMQFFHIDPKWSNFKEICDCNKLKSEQSHVFDIWKMACISTYDEYWIKTLSSASEHPWLKEVARRNNLKHFVEEEQAIIKKLNEQPTPTVLDKIWYLFFATGNYKYLKLCFETAGNQKCKLSLRDDALQMFETFRNCYQEKIEDALSHNPNYFKNADVESTRDAPNVWERLDEEILGKKKELAEIENEAETTDAEIDELLANMKKYEFVKDAEMDMTPQEKKHHHEVMKGVDVFNRVLQNINAEDANHN